MVPVYLMPQPWQTGTTYIKYFQLKEATMFADLQELASSQNLTGVYEKLENASKHLRRCKRFYLCCESATFQGREGRKNGGAEKITCIFYGCFRTPYL
ncbi:hypothetical protein CEXT_301041 [Caerostris extrusa]|uniref:Uncharacterized protein n=1 Tax=Caerostris extrusa TaxID=172846 RepID=A0AAV4PY72_CAEEX|nr:hypothetical protein CEXT_301041 [Caerostris extrusa]